MMGDHHPSRDSMTKGDSCPAAHNDDERGSSKGAKSNDVESTVTSDSLIILYEKFHLPNDLVAKILEKMDRARLPPPGYLTFLSLVCELGCGFPLLSS
ncbi:hypothetical protein IEQ34_022180 [Dendrobium chrysotoxum]|uniref:Uncharacterized protein n=1 Tax=Dendrobium chrysotoxum TaxID=161865 RepID=A0AAV7FK10_DENCH|nr:hypothetical protein IEQ34_022180 [Dendrobium chrysotoxum]